jgi:hypothetical protein
MRIAAHQRGIALSAALLLVCACRGMKDPGSVADKFVDRYYVESDQEGARGLAAGTASLRLQDEMKLVREGRMGGPLRDVRQVRVYYTRSAIEGQGDERRVDYRLDIRPQGGGELRRDAHLELSRQRDGTWRVTRFSETQP